MDIVIFVIVIILVFFLVVYVCSIIEYHICKPLILKISEMSYDSTEVRIFCIRVGASLEDFIASKGLQKQYLLFRDGKTSDFIQQSENKKKTDDARSDGQAVGLATGIAIGTIINAGN